MQKEKIALEQKLEYEQECMVNRLQRQIQAIHREKRYFSIFSIFSTKYKLAQLLTNSELRNRLRDDTQLLIHTLKSSIELMEQAKSASATPAFGYSPSLYHIIHIMQLLLMLN